jgi:hypothetical protein
VSSAWAQLEITPYDATKSVYPGDVVEAKIQILDETLVNKVKPAQLRTLGEAQHFLFMSLSTMQKDASGWHLQSKIVLGPNFSPDKAYSLVVGDNTVEVRFRGWMWNPQTDQINPEFDYENIPLFSRSWFQKNLWSVILGFLFVCGAAAFALNRWKTKNQIKKKQMQEVLKWQRLIHEAQSMQDLSALWKSRDELKTIFPLAENDLRSFFDNLNGSQFKPQVLKDELERLLLQKKQLLEKIRGGQGGV